MMMKIITNNHYFFPTPTINEGIDSLIYKYPRQLDDREIKFVKIL